MSNVLPHSTTTVYELAAAAYKFANVQIDPSLQQT